MTTKEKLNQAYVLEKRIKDNELELVKLRSEAEGLKSQDFQEKVQTTPRHDKIVDMIQAILDLNALLTNQRIELFRAKYEILTLIQKAETEEYKRLLELRYIKNLKWEEIALEMNYNYKYIHKLHSKALFSLEK